MRNIWERRVSDRIPANLDEITYLYFAEDGGWPPAPFLLLRKDLDWLQEGQVLAIRDLRPESQMGKVTHVRVLEVQAEIQLHRGRYGQLVRKVLLEPIPSMEEVNRIVAEGDHE